MSADTLVSGGVREAADVPSPVRLRAAGADDFERLRERSEGLELDRLVLRPRFGSLEAFFREAVDPHTRRAFLLAEDATRALVAWAACLRFHERDGYAPAALCVIEIGATRMQQQAADELLDRCGAACADLGVTTLVAMLHASMSDALAWHARHDFRACGSIALSGGQRLKVLALRGLG